MSIQSITRSIETVGVALRESDERVSSELLASRAFGALPLAQATGGPAIDAHPSRDPASAADQQAHEECADNPASARAVGHDRRTSVGVVMCRRVVSAATVVLDAAMVSATVGTAAVPVASTEASTGVLRERR
jgi:hypothetical protein